jgi:hypothetical protein
MGETLKLAERAFDAMASTLHNVLPTSTRRNQSIDLLFFTN